MRDTTVEVKANIMESVEDYRYLVWSKLLTGYTIQATLGRALELFGTHWWITDINEVAGDDGVVNDAKITMISKLPFAEVPLQCVLESNGEIDHSLMDTLAETMVSSRVEQCRDLMKDHDFTGLEYFYEDCVVTASPEEPHYVNVAVPEVYGDNAPVPVDTVFATVEIIPMITFTWRNLIRFIDIFDEDAYVLIDR